MSGNISGPFMKGWITMKLACSTWMMPGDTFSEKIKKAASYGFEGVEIRLFDNEAKPERIQEILEALKEHGVEPCSLIMPGETYRKPLLDRETLKAKEELAVKALDAAALLGAPTLVCPEYGAQSPLPLFDHPIRPTPKQRELLLEYLSFVADYAVEVGAKATIEPINRYETRFYYTLEDGAKIIDEVGKPGLYLLADFFHMNIEEVSIPDAIRKYGDKILHVHLGDSNRFLPGQGHTDFRSGFQALKEIGYDHFMAFECGIKGDPDIAFPRCVKFLRDAER